MEFGFKQTFGDKWRRFLQACDPIISVTELKETQTADPNQWPGLILSSSTTGLLIEGVLVPI